MDDERPIQGRPAGLIATVAAIVLVVGAGVVVLVGSILAPGAWSSRSGAGDPDRELAEFLATLEIRPFQLIDQDERIVDESIFASGDRYTILAFTFTYCQTACPIMNGYLLQLHHELAGSPVRIVSITVDPERDNPARLREHADDMGIDTSRWMFLTGAMPVIRSMITEQLHFGLSTDLTAQIPLPDGTLMNNIAHPTKLLLFNPTGKIIGLYTGLSQDGPDRLMRDVRRLAARR